MGLSLPVSRLYVRGLLLLDLVGILSIHVRPSKFNRKRDLIITIKSLRQIWLI